jgi:hypothetical protein
MLFIPVSLEFHLSILKLKNGLFKAVYVNTVSPISNPHKQELLSTHTKENRNVIFFIRASKDTINLNFLSDIMELKIAYEFQQLSVDNCAVRLNP